MPVRVHVDGRQAQAASGDSLFDVAEGAGVRVPTSCRAQGKCRECLVEVESGADLLTPRTEEEVTLAQGFRLSCRARLDAGQGTLRCHTLRRGTLQIEEGAALELPAGELDPPALRRGLATDGPPLGLAVDLGTTTVVLGLHDLTDGRVLARHSFENPQRFGGSDVMARIHHDGSHPGRLLQRVLRGYLARAIESLPGKSTDILELVIAGNPTMRDLFFGLDVQPIGEAPYRSTDEGSLTEAAGKLRLPLHPDATVYGMPLIASHVGADAAAAALATDLVHQGGTAVLLDIGTNTELLVAGRGRRLAASCPAGPAFEGGPIRCGMPALAGAIERVTLQGDGSVETRVIGGGVPEGICGSGLVDLLGELLRTGRMNSRGRLTGGAGFVVDAEHGLDLNEFDINELAQAKGANAAGMQAVLQTLGVRAAEVDRFYLAGGFARHLGLAAAKRIGLLPDVPDERFVRVGNASLLGASRALLASAARQELEEVVRTFEHVRLETHPRFFDFFVDGCQFAPFGVS